MRNKQAPQPTNPWACVKSLKSEIYPDFGFLNFKKYILRCQDVHSIPLGLAGPLVYKATSPIDYLHNVQDRKSTFTLGRAIFSRILGPPEGNLDLALPAQTFADASGSGSG